MTSNQNLGMPETLSSPGVSLSAIASILAERLFKNFSKASIEETVATLGPHGPSWDMVDMVVGCSMLKQ